MQKEDKYTTLLLDIHLHDMGSEKRMFSTLN